MAQLQSLHSSLKPGGCDRASLHGRRVPARHLFRLVFLLPILATTTFGCATHAQRIVDARHAFFSGDLSTSAELLDKAERKHRSDRDAVLLDKAIVALVQGKPAEAEATLREVRDRFEYLEQSSLAEEGLTLLADDTRRAYSGEDYEKVLIRAFLALANLMHDGGDAGAYCLQVNRKQNEIIEQGLPGMDENPKLAYQRVAIGAYLHGVLQEATHVNYDDAQRSFATVASWQPAFTPAAFDLARARSGVHSSPGNGVVYVFALVGRGPYKEQTTAPATSEALLVADRILTAFGDHSLPPTIAPVKVPRVVVPSNAVKGVELLANQQRVGMTQTVTDIGRLAVGQHAATRHHLIARAVARRAVKKSTVYATKDALNIDNPWSSLALDLAGVVWEATEAADTRGWALLPEKIQVLRLEMPAGRHRLALRATNGQAPIGPSYPCEVEVADGTNTYVLACFPGSRLVGQVIVSRPAPGKL